MTREQLAILERMEQFPPDKGGELYIGKNDPKNEGLDYWWCSYGEIHLSGYYSLPQLLADLAEECLKKGYVEPSRNALLTD